MGFVMAGEAEVESTRTLYYLSAYHVGSDSVTATGSRAPSKVGIILNERLGDEMEVLFEHRLFDKRLYDLVRNGEFTVDGRTGHAKYLSFGDFHRQVGVPAGVTYAMSAG
jgi:hypothetical protein